MKPQRDAARALLAAGLLLSSTPVSAVGVARPPADVESVEYAGEATVTIGDGERRSTRSS